MTLTFQNFNTKIAAIIRLQGEDYFQEDRVSKLEHNGDGEWTACVEEADGHVHDVEIREGVDGELECSCTCPYAVEWEGTCKHIAAVLYAIEAIGIGRLTQSPRPGQPARDESLSSVLSRLSHDELVQIVAEAASQDIQLRNRLLAQYSESGDKAQYARMFEDALNVGREERYGDFIDYDGAGEAASAADQILDRAETLLVQGKSTRAVSILQAGVETLIPALVHSDDSNGELGGCVERALCLLRDAADQLDEGDRHSLLRYCAASAPSQRYSGWDWSWDLAQLAADLVATPEERAEVGGALERMGRHRDPDSASWLLNYDLQRAEEIRLSIIERLDGEDAALAFMIDHVHLASFRHALIDRHLERREFLEVKRLCNEALGEQSQAEPGTQRYYQATLLSVAEREHDAAEVVRLARILFVAEGDFGLYTRLKQTVKRKNWPEFVTALILDVRQAAPYRTQTLADIYVAESMWAELFSLVEEHGVDMLEHYHKQLAPHFPQEMCQIYERGALKLLENTTGRETYALAAHYLSRMKGLGQAQRVQEIVEWLVSTYRNRRAMIEELRRV